MPVGVCGCVGGWVSACMCVLVDCGCNYECVYLYLDVSEHTDERGYVRADMC